MTLKDELAIKKNRLATLRNSGKDNTGVQRRLEREIRNLESKIK